MRRIIFTLALLAAFMPAARAKDLTKVTLVQSSQSMNFVPIYIAQTEGYFKEEGLDVTVVLAGGGPKAMTALIGGGGQFSASVLLDGIMAHRRGLTDVKALATLSYFLAPMAVRADVAKQHGRHTAEAAGRGDEGAENGHHDARCQLRPRAALSAGQSGAAAGSLP